MNVVVRNLNHLIVSPWFLHNVQNKERVRLPGIDAFVYEVTVVHVVRLVSVHQHSVGADRYDSGRDGH